MTMTPCHAQKYEEALQGMRQYVSRMFPGPMPAWGQAAIEQHAHYYAAQACGEKPMAYGTFNDYAALGITRRGANDGTVRTISMAGYGAYTCQACNRIPGVKDGYNCPVCSGGANQRTERRMGGFSSFGAAAISQVTGQPCYADNFQNNWEGYCDCLFPKSSELMKVCCGKDNLNPDGSCGKAQWWTGKGFINAPWTLLGKGERYLRSSGLSDALKQQYEDITSGKAPGGTGTGGGGGTDTGGPGDTGGGGGGGGGGAEAPKMNTALIVGGAAVLVAAIFLLKK